MKTSQNAETASLLHSVAPCVDPVSESPAPGYESVRSECRREMEDYGISIARASAEMGKGVSQGTLSTWLRGSYRGDVDAVTGRIEKWLMTRAEARSHGLEASGLGRHVQLGVTEEIEAALSYAQAAGDLSLVHGRSGLGKSWAAIRYCATHSAAHRLQVTVAMMRPAGLLNALASAIGAGEGYRSAMAAEKAVIDAVSGRSALLVVDEAHHLNARLLDELRCIRDVAGCGLAMIGADELWTTLRSNSRCDQIVGRIGVRLPLGRTSQADVLDLSAAVLGRRPAREEAEMLARTARGAGGLHALQRMLTRAWVSCRSSGRERIGSEDLHVAAEAA